MKLEELSADDLKKTQLDVLEVLDEFCKKNNITYYIAYGTLLGAVRHKGYIPWDDDIDVIMPRKDYENFARLFHHNQYIFASSQTYRDWPFLFGKLYDNNTELIEDMNYKNISYGVNIDVFPLDNLSNNKMKRFFYLKKIWILCMLYSLKIVDIKVINNKLKRSFIFILHKIPFISVLRLKSYIEKCTFKTNMSVKDPEQCFVLGINSNKKIELYNYNYFIERTLLLFENRHYFAPDMYHEILTVMYGKYMQLPPLEKQITHHSYKAYKKNND